MQPYIHIYVSFFWLHTVCVNFIQLTVPLYKSILRLSILYAAGPIANGGRFLLGDYIIEYMYIYAGYNDAKLCPGGDTQSGYLWVGWGQAPNKMVEKGDTHCVSFRFPRFWWASVFDLLNLFSDVTRWMDE